MADHRRAAFVIAWGGTLAFAASLLLFLYAYLFRFVDPSMRAASGMPTADSAAVPAGIDTLLFSVFALHHSVFARARVKAIVQRLVPPELERSLYTWVASLLFALVCWWWLPVPGTLYRLEQPWRALAFAVQAAGLVMTIHASRLLDVLDLSGVRPVQRAAANAPARHVALKTTGVYGFVRHPLYFAWMILVFATPDMTATRLVFAVVSTLYLGLAIPWEERALVQIFGREYEQYRRLVRWRMVPFLY
jgi:protein-S-isoprenylcysteine O-methyltransferase Ste14